MVTLKVQEKKKEEEGTRINGGERRRGGGDAPGRDAALLWSRALNHPLRCNGTRHRVIRGRDVTELRKSDDSHLGFDALI